MWWVAARAAAAAAAAGAPAAAARRKAAQKARSHLGSTHSTLPTCTMLLTLGGLFSYINRTYKHMVSHPPLLTCLYPAGKL